MKLTIKVRREEVLTVLKDRKRLESLVYVRGWSK
jgi:hypothetical protein